MQFGEGETDKPNDEMFHLFSNMLQDLSTYIYGVLGMRDKDVKVQQMCLKRMYDQIYVSNQRLYKHILRETLAEYPSWSDVEKTMFELAPGANEVEGSKGALMAYDETMRGRCPETVKWLCLEKSLQKLLLLHVTQCWH